MEEPREAMYAVESEVGITRTPIPLFRRAMRRLKEVVEHKHGTRLWYEWDFKMKQ
jgi:hypothetical protein